MKLKVKPIFTLLLALIVVPGPTALAQEKAQEQKAYKAYMVSNAHFDSQWNWDVQTSIDAFIHNTLTQNLWLLERYPQYIFNFEGGIKYSWMKEYYPALYEEVKKWVAAGRWRVCGSTWDATDPNIPSSESFFRNILLGQHFYRQEFGTEGNDIFLPDCFGFGYTLPTIARHAGLKGFSTQKLQWRKLPFYGESKVPFSIGLWQGLDGSRVMAALNAQNYGQRWDGVDLSRDEQLIALAKDGVNHTAYRYYGTGDQGGSPTIPTVETLIKSMQSDGPVELISAWAGQLYEDYYPFEKHPELPVFDGELLMDLHATGCYTSQAAMKRFNRRNEQLADEAERASVMAHWTGALPYAAEEIRGEWKRFIWHQFHDDLTGTSIPRAYTFSWNDELIAQTRFAGVMHAAGGAMASQMDTRVTGIPVVVYNAVAAARKGLVEVSVPMQAAPKSVALRTPQGKRVPGQILGFADGLLRVVFPAAVPSVGYSVYDLLPGSSAKAQAVLKASGNTLENAVYKVTLDARGDLASIVDKRCGRELVAPGKAFRLALFPHNASLTWPAWEIMKETVDQAPVALADAVEISVAETGPVRATLKVSRRYGESTFVQYISLTAGAADERIDIRNEVDWCTTDALLKAEFPMTVSNPQATYDLGLGYVKRGNNTPTAYEVYAQQWADLTDAQGQYGVSILNDCKYGWDKPADNMLRLTLLHTPSTQRRYTYQSRQDFGHHVFTYSIVGHPGTPVDAAVAAQAEGLNHPLSAYTTAKHSGTLGKTFSFVPSLSQQLGLKALKQAESGEGYVVRVNELSGKALQNGAVEFCAPIAEAYVLNGVEDVQGPAAFEGTRLQVSCGAFAPSTFLVKLQKPAQPAQAPVNAPLALPYNDYALTVDAFARQGNIDGKGGSYAAELVPARLDSRGVSYTLQNNVASSNVVKCDGQVIELPQGAQGRLCLLVASVQDDQTADFVLDGVAHSRTVPYYSGFFGQWGHDGGQGYVRQAYPAYVGTHRHSREKANESYVFTYMYEVFLPVPAGARQLTLPKNPKLLLFAATLSQSAGAEVQPLTEVRALP